MWIDTESEMHRSAKEMVCDHLNHRDKGKAYYIMEYPLLLNCGANSIKRCPLSWREKVPTFQECIQQKKYPKKVIDIVGIKADTHEPFIFIEICHTHPVDAQKLNVLKECLLLSDRPTLPIVEIHADWILSAPLPTRLGGQMLHPQRKTLLSS